MSTKNIRRTIHVVSKHFKSIEFVSKKLKSIVLLLVSKPFDRYLILTQKIRKLLNFHRKHSKSILFVSKSILCLNLSSKQKYMWYPSGTKIWIFWEEMREIFKSLSRNILKPTTPSWSPHMKNLRNFYDFHLLFGDFGPFGHIVGVSGVNRGICGTP